MNVKNILIFVSGLVIGGTAGVLGSKKYFQNKYQKQYEEDRNALEEYYQRTDEYVRCDQNEEELEDDGINSPEGDSRLSGRMTSEERAAIKEKLNKNWSGTTNYAGMYRTKNGHTEGKLAEAEHPLDQGEDGEEDPDNFEEVSPEEEAFDEHQKNRNKPPKIISAETYGELPAYIEKKVLYFYTYDEMVVDEDNDDEPITEPERLIGDALTKYDFVDNDERIIFVMNYALDTCYEIQKIDASWTDTH